MDKNTGGPQMPPHGSVCHWAPPVVASGGPSEWNVVTTWITAELFNIHLEI